MQKNTKRSKNPDTPEATSKYYLPNSRLLPEVVRAKELGRITDELAEMLLMLTRKNAQRPCFSGYSYKDDMISEALTNLCQNALKFNPEKSSNPFAYYTTCINSSFLQFLNVEKKHRRIRDQLLVDVGENPSFNFQDEAKNNLADEMEELKTNIEEARIRLKQDAEYAAAKAAAQLAEMTEKILEVGVEVSDSFEQIVEEELDHEAGDLIPQTSLLDFGEDTTS